MISVSLIVKCVHYKIIFLHFPYQDCKLIHGDFSEYNLMYHRGHPYVIDVSQAVERCHPRALNFLKRDCANITQFFVSARMHRTSAEHDEDDDRKEYDNRQYHDDDVDDEDAIIDGGDDKKGRREQQQELHYDGESLHSIKSSILSTVDEAVAQCGEALNHPWPLYSVETLFRYVTEINFLRMSEDGSWVSFDTEEDLGEKGQIIECEFESSSVDEKRDIRVESGAVIAGHEKSLALPTARRRAFSALLNATLHDLDKSDTNNNNINLEQDYSFFLQTEQYSNLGEVLYMNISCS